MKKYLQKVLFGIQDLDEVKSQSEHIKSTTYNMWNEEDSNKRNKMIFEERYKKLIEYYSNL